MGSCSSRRKEESEGIFEYLMKLKEENKYRRKKQEDPNKEEKRLVFHPIENKAVITVKWS